MQITGLATASSHGGPDIDVTSHPPGAPLPPVEFADGEINETGNRGVDPVSISYTDDLVIALSDRNVTNALRGSEDTTARFYDYLNRSSYSLTVFDRGSTSSASYRIELNESATTVACEQQCDLVYVRVPLYDVDYHRISSSGEDGERVSPSEADGFYDVELRVDRNGSQSVIATDDFDLDPPSVLVRLSRTNGKRLELVFATDVEANMTARIEPVSHDGEAIPIELERSSGARVYNRTVSELQSGSRYELRVRANGYNVSLLDGASEERFYVTAGAPVGEIDLVRMTDSSVVVNASLSAGGFLAVEAKNGTLNSVSDRLKPGEHQVSLPSSGRDLTDKSVVAYVDTDGDGELNRTHDTRYESTLRLEISNMTSTTTQKPNSGTPANSSPPPSSETGAGFGIVLALVALALVMIHQK